MSVGCKSGIFMTGWEMTMFFLVVVVVYLLFARQYNGCNLLLQDITAKRTYPPFHRGHGTLW